MLVCRVAGQGSLAQIPLTLSQDKQVVKTISLTGADTQWRSEEILLNPTFNNTTFLKFYFGQTGMEIRECRIELKESHEEKLREMMLAGKEEE